MSYEQEDQEHSPAPTNDAEAGDQPATPDTAPESTPSTPESAPDTSDKGTEPASLEDAIRSVIKPEEPADDDDPEKGEESEGGDKPEGEPKEGKPAQDGQDDDDQDADELSDDDKRQKPETRKRISKLLQQRKEYRDRAEAAETQVNDLEPLANDMRGIREFMGQTGVTGEDATMLFQIGAILRSGDYQGFLDAIEPFVTQARIATGQALAPDLQKAVDDGRIDEEEARRISVERAKTQREHAQLEADKAKESARAQETAKALDTRTANEIRTAVNDWIAERRANDPDFSRREAAIQEMAVDYVKANGRPANAAEAVEVMKRLYARIAPPTPAAQPKPTRPSPDGMSAATPPNPGKQPQSLAEAMRAGLRAAQGR